MTPTHFPQSKYIKGIAMEDTTLHESQKTIGLPPGDLHYTGENTDVSSNVRLIKFQNEDFHDTNISPNDYSIERLDLDRINWMHVSGIHNVNIVKKIGIDFGLHNLTLEDILHINQRPKIETHKDYTFLTVKYFETNQGKDVAIEQFSFILKGNTLITFSESNAYFLQPFVDRIQNSHSRVRSEGVDYLLYGILDFIVDQYSYVLQRINEQIINIEKKMTSLEPTAGFTKIYHLRGQINLITKNVNPLKEVSNTILKSDSNYVSAGTIPYFKDLQDHIIQMVESLHYYDLKSASLIDILISINSFRMNEVMKILTVFATIFMPLTFITGLYGMNFQNMPELTTKWGYFTVLGLMLLLTIGSLFYMKRKKWI